MLKTIVQVDEIYPANVCIVCGFEELWFEEWEPENVLYIRLSKQGWKFLYLFDQNMSPIPYASCCPECYPLTCYPCSTMNH